MIFGKFLQHENNFFLIVMPLLRVQSVKILVFQREVLLRFEDWEKQMEKWSLRIYNFLVHKTVFSMLVFAVFYVRTVKQRVSLPLAWWTQMQQHPKPGLWSRGKKF